jgi:hypothetical protein
LLLGSFVVLRLELPQATADTLSRDLDEAALQVVQVHNAAMAGLEGDDIDKTKLSWVVERRTGQTAECST